MAIQSLADNFAPYTSFDSLKKVIQRAREKGLPDQVSAETLGQIGVPSSMTSFVLRALVFLKLIDEGGNVTEAFSQLRRASTDEYPSTLAEIVKRAYVKVFAVVDPAIHGAVEVGDAFRAYEPLNQREKMVRLFMGLCEEANIITPGSVKHRSRTARPRASGNGASGAVNLPPPSPPPTDKLHPGLAGLIGDLPTKGVAWTKAERDRWLAAFTNSLNYVYPPTKNKEGA